MDRPRRYRGLRIAVSAVCLIAGVLLAALWLRSYSFHDILEIKTATGPLQVHFVKGRVTFWKNTIRNNPRLKVSDRAAILDELSLGQTVSSSPIRDSAGILGGNGILGFGRWGHGGTTIVFAPYWFPVLLTATMAVLPWVRWSRRFSLRTLLAAMTLVALVFGAVVYAVR